MPDNLRPLASEALGTAFLLMAVVGSGIMAERLAGGNVALALLCNALATGAALVALISIFGPLSGAHFNPAVTLYFTLRREMPTGRALAYMAAQVTGAILGVLATHVMFALPLLEVSQKLRDGAPQGLAEFIATFGLLAVIAGSQNAKSTTPMLVGLYITAAYWFTASTSFANPVVTLARALSDTFAGIAPSSVPAFVVAQLVATLLAWPVLGWLWRPPSP